MQMMWKQRPVWPPGPPIPPIPPRKPVRILAVSDEESKFIWEHFDPELFRGVDLILSCGDLKASYLSYLVTMIPAPLLYVYGNHDGAYDRNPPLGCQCIDGAVTEFQGIRIAGLGGCMGDDPANPYQFTEEKMEKRVRKLQSDLRRSRKLDILVTHAPAAGVGDSSAFHQGFRCFHQLYRDNVPTLHLFGHLHRQNHHGPEARQGVFQVGATRAVNCTGYRLIEL